MKEGIARTFGEKSTTMKEARKRKRKLAEIKTKRKVNFVAQHTLPHPLQIIQKNSINVFLKTISQLLK